MIKKFAKTNPQFKRLTCNGIVIDAKVANTDEERARGLGGVEALGPNEGMLFDFGTEQPAAFWMKNCKFNISLAFMTENKIIVGIQNMFKDAPTRLHSSPIPIRYALEVSEGFFAQNGISVGDKISF